MECLSPCIEDPLGLNIDGIFMLDSLKVGLVKVLEELSDGSALGCKFIELLLFLKELAFESSFVLVDFAGTVKLTEHMLLKKFLGQESFLAFFDCLVEDTLPHHRIATSHYLMNLGNELLIQLGPFSPSDQLPERPLLDL